MTRRAWILGALAGCLSGCFPFGSQLSRQAKDFTQAHPDGFKTLDVEGHPMRYAVAGRAGAPTVVFIHGSPGGWDAWAGYLQDAALLARARLIAVDRPGYGGSERGRAEPSLAEQAKRIAAVIRVEGPPAILVGHSLGGPIACQVGLDFPELSRSLLLLAPSIDPAMEEEKWFQVPASWGWVRACLPSELDVCNQEILPLKGQLELLLPRWAGMRPPVRLLQGTDDGLVPAENADFAERVLPKERLRVDRLAGMDHFIPWRRPELVAQAILDALGPP